MYRNPLTLVLVFTLCGAALGQDSNEPKRLQKQINKLQEQIDKLEQATREAKEAEALSKQEELKGEDSPLLYAFRSLETYGSLTASYTYNLGGVDRRRGGNRFRLSDSDNNTFSIPFARLGIKRYTSGFDDWDVGFGLEVAAGSMVPDLFKDDGLFEEGAINVPQAYIDLQLPTSLPMILRAGRMYLPFGVESVDPQQNLHHSTSFLKQIMPQTVTGLGLGIGLSPNLSYTQYVVNGWDKVVDNNDAKTFAGQLAWNPEGSGAEFALNWIAGAEREDSESDARWTIEFTTRWQATKSLVFQAAFLYGQEDFSSPLPQFDDVNAEFGGFTASLRKSFLYDADDNYHQLAFAVRGSVFRDEFGVRTQTGLDQTLSEVTATLELRPIKEATLRVEYRRDFSSRSDAFGGGRGKLSRDSQDTFTFSVGANF